LDLSDRYGRTPFYIFCMGASGILMPLLVWFVGPSWSDDSEVTSTALIVIYAICIDLNIATWNSLNTAFVGEYFPMDPSPGFANLKLWAGLTQALFFFLPRLDNNILLVGLFVASALAIIGHLYARYRLSRDLSRRNL